MKIETVTAVRKTINELIGISAYLRTCDPEVIIENRLSTAASAENAAKDLAKAFQSEITEPL